MDSIARQSAVEQIQAAGSSVSSIIAVIETLLAAYGDQLISLLPGLLKSAGVPDGLIPVIVAVATWLVHLKPAT